MIFLNKTCFNGLYRVNSSGKFNVPFGRYKHPTICDEENLRACAAALYGVTLRTVGFSQQLVAAPYHPPKKGDFVYCDPPFVPLSDTANFTSYTKIGFDIQHQEQLAAIARKLAEAGVYVMLSNHDTPVVRKLYKGFTIERVYAIRSINSKTTKRGAVKEVIIRNYT
jgi:DNA adenine methylase